MSEIKVRPNVTKHLPVLRKQIQDYGWKAVRDCLIRSDTKFLSGKDRRQLLQILSKENQ